MSSSLVVHAPEPCSIRVEQRELDEHGTKVIVLDGVLRDVDAVRSAALDLSYAEADSYYPGVTATPDWDPAPLAAALRPYLEGPADLSAIRLWCSMVTKRAADLTPEQSVPHWDGAGMGGVIYLNPPAQCRGGTAFYRHRATGLIAAPNTMSIPLYLLMRRHGFERYDDFIRWVIKPPADGSEFALDSTDDWELNELVEMRYNRLVLFDGRLFHSGYVEDGTFEGAATQRRLTINFAIPEPEGQP